MFDAFHVQDGPASGGMYHFLYKDLHQKMYSVCIQGVNALCDEWQCLAVVDITLLSISGLE